MKKYISAIFLFLLFCQPAEKKPNNPYAELFRNSPATNLDSYKPGENWRERIFPLSGRHSEYIKELNRIDGFDETPSAPENFSAVKDLLARSSFKPEVEKQLNKHIFGIYLCENLGGSGVSGIVYDSNKPVGGFIILDSRVLYKKANDWITGKERSVFEKGPLDLRIEIEEPGENTITGAMRYILLHEAGHVLAVVHGLLPDYRLEYRDFENFPFLKGVWPKEEESIYDASFPLRNKIKFYTSKKGLPLEKEWVNIYPVMEKTAFPTLYSAMHPDEYVAEYFVSYVHTVIDNKKWELTIRDNDQLLFRTGNGVQRSRDSMQYSLIRKIFQDK